MISLNLARQIKKIKLLKHSRFYKTLKIGYAALAILCIGIILIKNLYNIYFVQPLAIGYLRLINSLWFDMAVIAIMLAILWGVMLWLGVKIQQQINSNEYVAKKINNLQSLNNTMLQDSAKAANNFNDLVLQTEKMATLGTLTAGMTHEFNNHLGGIIQSLQNIYRRLDPDFADNIKAAEEIGVDLDKVNAYLRQRKILDFMQGIKEMSNRSVGIVRSVLRFSHVSAPMMEQADVNAMIDDILAMLLTDQDIKHQINIDRLTITTELSADLPQIYCLPTEIQQVLLNLIKNACQAMKEKQYQANEEPKLLLRTIPGKNSVKLEIKDNGPGISAAVKQHLFETFFTTKPVGVGTGLGLSISHYIVVDRHHGKITVDTKQGVGTTFTVILPIKA